MDKIQKEEYVRTQRGIAKIEDLVCGQDAYFDNENIIEPDYINLYINNGIDIYGSIFRDLVVKHSKNIIDLIEVGDVLKLKSGEKWEVQEHQGDGNWIQTEWEVIENEEDFKNKVDSIVTKEQFSSLEYII